MSRQNNGRHDAPEDLMAVSQTRDVVRRRLLEIDLLGLGGETGAESEYDALANSIVGEYARDPGPATIERVVARWLDDAGIDWRPSFEVLASLESDLHA